MHEEEGKIAKPGRSISISGNNTYGRFISFILVEKNGLEIAVSQAERKIGGKETKLLQGGGERYEICCGKNGKKQSTNPPPPL